MTKYAVSPEGAEALRKLASDIRNLMNHMSSCGRSLQNTMMSYEEGLGGFSDQAIVLSSDCVAAVASASASADAIACSLESKAATIESLLGGPTLSGASSSSSAISNKSPWPPIVGSHTPQTDAAVTNPGYDPKVSSRSENCQRCVGAWDMRRRGNDVQAQPINKGLWDFLSKHPWASWENARVLSTTGSGKSEIETQMANWGDGSRAVIGIKWAGVSWAHVFVAEQVNGRTVFLEPQNSEVTESDASEYFQHAEPNRTIYWRIDNIPVSSYMNDCCERRA